MALASDNFNRGPPSEPIDDSANWTISMNMLRAGYGGVAVYGFHDDYSAAFWSAREWAADQTSQVKLTAAVFSPTALMGVCVRATTGNYYAFIASKQLSYVFKFTGGDTWTNLHPEEGTYSGIAVDDVIRLEAEGTTLRAYINDVLEATVTDSDLSSGSPGVASHDHFVTALLDDWEGDEISAGGGDGASALFGLGF
jgi:hypothetical protein